MKPDPIFSSWCATSVPILIGHIVEDCKEAGGTFFLEAKTQITIKGTIDISFELPVPDNVVDIDDPTNVSRAGLGEWVKVVSDHIFNVWDKSYNGKKHKLLDDLKMFSIIYPKMAQDLLMAVVFEKGEFTFDLNRSQYGEISLMAAKFDDFKKKRESNTYNINKPDEPPSNPASTR
jgi:hypothetical protein